MHAETVAKVTLDLKKEGKIRQLGVSNFTPSQMSLLQQEVKLEWNQLECSLTHENGLFDRVRHTESVLSKLHRARRFKARRSIRVLSHVLSHSMSGVRLE